MFINAPFTALVGGIRGAIPALKTAFANLFEGTVFAAFFDALVHGINGTGLAPVAPETGLVPPVGPSGYHDFLDPFNIEGNFLDPFNIEGDISDPFHPENTTNPANAGYMGD